MSLQWNERQTASMQVATLEIESITIEVCNYDDDLSKFTVKDASGQIHATGESCIGDHFARCKAAAWNMVCVEEPAV